MNKIPVHEQIAMRELGAAKFWAAYQGLREGADGAAALDMAAIAADAMAEQAGSAFQTAFVRACRMLRELPDGDVLASYLHDVFNRVLDHEPPAWSDLADALRGK